MNELIVIAFADELEADEVLVTVRRSQMGGEINIRDTAVAIKTRRGRLIVRQTTEISTSRHQQPDGWWGLLIALMLGGSMGRHHYGEGFTRLYGRLSELGIEDQFVVELSEAVEPGQSALFLLVTEWQRDEAIAMSRNLGGRVLSTPLSEDSIGTILETVQSSAPRFETG